MTDSTSHSRPNWLVDIKWISGLLLFVVLQILLLVNCLTMITSEKVALDTMSIGLASVYNLEKGINDITEIKELKRALKTSPNASIKPIQGIPITLKAEDIASLSREIRIYVFRQAAQYIYRGETEKYLNQVDKGGEQSVGTEFRLLALISAENHQKLAMGLLLLAGICLVLLIPLVLFSHRFGRIASPGFVLAVAGLPGMFFFNLLKLLFSNNSSDFTPAGATESVSGMIGYIALNTLPPLLDDILAVYYAVSILGLLLTFVALVSLIGRKIYLEVKADKAQ